MDFCYWTLAMHCLEMHACIFKRFLFCGVGLFVCFLRACSGLIFLLQKFILCDLQELQVYDANCCLYRCLEVCIRFSQYGFGLLPIQ